jgi:putative transposase
VNVESRDKCLSIKWFGNRIDAKIVIEWFLRQMNELSPHSSLGQLNLVEFKQKPSLDYKQEPALSKL